MLGLDWEFAPVEVLKVKTLNESGMADQIGKDLRLAGTRDETGRSDAPRWNKEVMTDLLWIVRFRLLQGSVELEQGMFEKLARGTVLLVLRLVPTRIVGTCF